MEGATVKFSGEVDLKTSLTVPVGVTLDLTTENVKFAMRDGAELTVDGTVNVGGHGNHGKGWVEGGLRIGEGTTVIKGSGTVRLQSKGRLLSFDGKRHLTLDGVTLVGIEDNDGPLVQVNEGGELVMKSGTITGNQHLSGDWVGGGGVSVYKGVFRIEGGTISANSTVGGRGASGGGVNIGEASVFTMTGGAITGNSASGSSEAQGGGVVVDKGTVIMEGGEISGNTVSGNNTHGGGVWVGNSSTSTMKGGKISDNSANGSEWVTGGGVAVLRGSVFTMEGGEISGNSVIVKENGIGGGVNAQFESVFTMLGGTISGNSANGSVGSRGGGVWLSSGGVDAFTMLGGTIYGNASVANAGGNANETKDGNGVPVSGRGAAIMNNFYRNKLDAVAKWGMGGTYTKGGVTQTGGSEIADKDSYGTDDTLIATPAK